MTAVTARTQGVDYIPKLSISPPEAPCPSPATTSAHPHYKWVALSNTTLGVLLATVNASIVLISLPAIFRGIELDPLEPSNVSYLLWMLMGYLLVTAVLVVSLGRLGDIYGRVKMYNAGFAVFAAASVALALVPWTGSAGALWLIGFRVVQGVGGAMLMANSTAILTDAFPTEQRGMALGINQVAALAGSFIGLVLGGLLAEWHWRSVFWVSRADRHRRHRLGLPVAARARPAAARAASTGSATSLFGVGLTALLAGITYGIQPYGSHDTGWTNPWVLAGLVGGAAMLVAVLVRRAPRRPTRCSTSSSSATAPSPTATRPPCSPRSPAAACSSC